jgi:hypothetical protein
MGNHFLSFVKFFYGKTTPLGVVFALQNDITEPYGFVTIQMLKNESRETVTEKKE